MSSTPPKAQTGATTQTQSQASTSVSPDALAFVDQLEDYVVGLKRELRSYGDTHTVGRDTARLRAFFQDIHRCELQIAQSMGIDWSPSPN